VSAPETPRLAINTASAEEIDALDQLKGHGFEIVRYRNDRGRFDALRQLEEVPGLAGKVRDLEGVVRFD
jgi:competence protein ComEA